MIYHLFCFMVQVTGTIILLTIISLPIDIYGHIFHFSSLALLGASFEMRISFHLYNTLPISSEISYHYFDSSPPTVISLWRHFLANDLIFHVLIFGWSCLYYSWERYFTIVSLCLLSSLPSFFSFSMILIFPSQNFTYYTYLFISHWLFSYLLVMIWRSLIAFSHILHYCFPTLFKASMPQSDIRIRRSRAYFWICHSRL